MRRSSRGTPDDRDRLEYMLEAASEALRYVSNRTRADLDTDSMLLHAITYCIQVIGEAATQVSDPGRLLAPALPWREMAKMRNVMVHVYWGIDRDRVWETVRQDLPPLIQQLQAALTAWPATNPGSP